MSVSELAGRPEAMADFPEKPYRFLELSNDGGVYGYAAVAGRADDLELHLTMTSWGPGIRRSLAEDLEWLKGEARRLGKRRILGIRADGDGEFDTRLFRFARLFGASETWVFQAALIDVDEKK